MTRYEELPALRDIVLEESYILRIRAEPGSVAFDGDFVLTRDHPTYVPPPPTEVECFRRGTLRFIGVESLRWDDQGAPPATDASGEKDYGHIDSLEVEDGSFRLAGDWGRMEIRAATAEVDLDPVNA